MRVTVEKTKLTPPELARLWGVSTGKIIAFIRSGELRSVNLARTRTNRPRYVIDVADIQLFEQARQVIPDGGLSATQKLRRRAAGTVKDFF